MFFKNTIPNIIVSINDIYFASIIPFILNNKPKETIPIKYNMVFELFNIPNFLVS